MKKVFIAVGSGSIVLGVIAFFALLTSPFAAIAAAVGFCLSGALMIAVGDLLGRVEYLEARLGLASSIENDPELPQKTCTVCGRSYDFDYPVCPHCGRENGSSGE